MRLEAIRQAPQPEVTWKQSCLLAVPNALGVTAVKIVEHARVKFSEKHAGPKKSST